MVHTLGVDVAQLALVQVVRSLAHQLAGSLPQLEDVVRLATEITGTTAGAINLVHADGQEALVAWGASPQPCGPDESMCWVPVTENGAVHVPDARVDHRFKDNPWVTGRLGRVRFYCAVPLSSPDGTTFGTLCTWDERKRRVTLQVRRSLAALAAHIEELMVVDAHGVELHQALDALAKEHVALRHSNMRLTQFAGQVAHDLKVPLSAAQLSLGMLREVPEVADSTAARALLDRVDDAGRRMEALITEFLALAAADREPSRAPVDLNEVLRDVLTDLAHLSGRHNVVVGRMPVVRGDAVQLHALLQNLVANALKFSSRSSRRIVRICGGGAAESWWFSVADSGPGIDVDHREAVFEPMVRLDPGSEGLGLGLATCRRVAINHHADISVHQAPEGGALVFVVATPHGSQAEAGSSFELAREVVDRALRH